MATTRPRAASSVVMASRRSPSNRACVVASTPLDEGAPLAGLACPGGAGRSVTSPTRARDQHVSGRRARRRRRPTSRASADRPRRPRPPPTAGPGGGGRSCGCTDRPPDSGRRGRCPRPAARPRCAARVSGISSVWCWPVATSITRRTLRSSPPSETPYATSAPLGRRVVPVDRRRRVGHQAGGIDEQARRRRSDRRPDGRRGRTASARHPARVRTRSAPARRTPVETGSSSRVTRRSSQARRSGRASSASRVRSFCAWTQAATSGASPSSSQR